MSTFRLWLLLGLCVGFFTIGGAMAVIPGRSPATQASAVATVAPHMMTAAEVDSYPECVPNQEWPTGQIPAGALIRPLDDETLIKVSFDEAMGHAKAKTAWYVGSCRPSVS